MATALGEKTYDVVVVGGGAAGVGVAIALNFAVLERHMVGASFAAWPAETRFITPSFPTNSIGMLDLNSIAIGVSPAFGMEVEHPTGATAGLEPPGQTEGTEGNRRMIHGLWATAHGVCLLL